MCFGCSDIELFQLAAWCKNLPADIFKSIHSQIFNSVRIRLLDQAGLLMVTENKKSIRLRENGWRLLEYLGAGYHKDSSYRSEYERRVESAQILLTFWRAGYNVFGSHPSDMGAAQVFVLSMAARRGAARAGDIWGGAAFWGLGRTIDTVFSCYYVTGHEKALFHYRSEKALLDKAAAMLGTKAAMIFAGRGNKGSGYIRIAKALGNAKSAKLSCNGDKMGYADIYRNAQVSIHLLECSDEGALQLLIMTQEDYRRRLGDTVFHGHASPPVGITSADGLLRVSETEAIPWLLAIDMDICRIDRAIRQTAGAGYSMIVIACLAKQEAALKILFSDDIAKYVIINDKNLMDAFGVLRLYEPVSSPYMDSKGGMIDATNIPICGKTGKQV